MSRLQIKMISAVSLITLTLILIVKLSTHQACTAGDGTAGMNKPYMAYSSEAACTKAMAMCRFYSSNPKLCVVKK